MSALQGFESKIIGFENLHLTMRLNTIHKIRVSKLIENWKDIN